MPLLWSKPGNHSFALFVNAAAIYATTPPEANNNTDDEDEEDNNNVESNGTLFSVL